MAVVVVEAAASASEAAAAAAATTDARPRPPRRRRRTWGWKKRNMCVQWDTAEAGPTSQKSDVEASVKGHAWPQMHNLHN